MCMKCGCGKKMGEKGYGKGPAKKVVQSKTAAKKPMTKRKAM